MEFVFSADLHIHPYRECSQDGGQDRLADGLALLRQMLLLSKVRDCPLVLGGDVKHLPDRWLLSVQNGILALLQEFSSVPVVMLHGNHDGIGGGQSGLQPFASLPNVTVFDTLGVWQPPKGEPTAMWPYCPAGAVAERAEQLLRIAREKRVGVLLGHVFLQGAALDATEVRLLSGVSLAQLGLSGATPVFRLAVLGDVHRGQQLGSASVYYAGSPGALSWGELQPDKGCLFVNTTAKRPVKRVPLCAPRFIVVNVPQEVLPTKLPQHAAGWAGHFVRLQWALESTDALPETAFLQQLAQQAQARAWQVVIRRPSLTAQRTTLHAGLPREQLLSAYVTACPPGDLDPKAVLTAGKKLLEGG